MNSCLIDLMPLNRSEIIFGTRKKLQKKNKIEIVFFITHLKNNILISWHHHNIKTNFLKDFFFRKKGKNY